MTIKFTLSKIGDNSITFIPDLHDRYRLDKYEDNELKSSIPIKFSCRMFCGEVITIENEKVIIEGTENVIPADGTDGKHYKYVIYNQEELIKNNRNVGDYNVQ